MNVIPRVRTPISADEAAPLLRRVYGSILGNEPSANALGSLMSLIWIETARGQSVNNHNFGNISASERFAGNVWRPPWFDFDGGTADTDVNRLLHDAMLRGQAPSAFRAYPDEESGMTDFVKQLRSSFTEVLAAAETADPDAFRVALSKKYSPDYKNPRSTATFATLFREFGLDPKAVAGAGAASSSQPGSVPLPTLRRGLFGPAVRLLSSLLGDPSEIYDAGVVSVVKAFQKSARLKEDGICGPLTWAALTNRTSSVGLTDRVVS